VAIVLLTAFVLIAHVTVPNVGDEGTLPNSLPTFGIPDVPFTLATLKLFAPYALGIALVGLLESLMTAKLVDDVTDTRSDKTRESWGQGVANIVTGSADAVPSDLRLSTRTSRPLRRDTVTETSSDRHERICQHLGRTPACARRRGSLNSVGAASGKRRSGLSFFEDVVPTVLPQALHCRGSTGQNFSAS
jgi:hypothetical protein